MHCGIWLRYVLLTLFIREFVCIDSSLSDLSSNHVLVSLAKHPEYALGEKLTDFSDTPFGAFREIPEYSRDAMIVQDGDLFSIKLNGKSLCVARGGEIQTCKSPTLFDFRPHPFGFRIMNGGLCLTADPQLKMRLCSATGSNQVFTVADQSSKFCEVNFDSNDSEESDESEVAPESSNPKKKKPKKKLNKKKEVLDDAIKKHKPKEEMKKVMSKLWDWNWGGWPSFNFC